MAQWLKSRDGNVINAAFVSNMYADGIEGGGYMIATIFNGTQVNLPGAWTTEAEAQDAMAQLSRALDATDYVDN